MMRGRLRITEGGGGGAERRHLQEEHRTFKPGEELMNDFRREKSKISRDKRSKPQ